MADDACDCTTIAKPYQEGDVLDFEVFCDACDKQISAREYHINHSRRTPGFLYCDDCSERGWRKYD